MRIRDAVPADAEAIAAIYNDAVENTTAIWNERTVDGDERRAWLAARNDQGYPVRVAVEDDADRQVLGYATFGDWRTFDGYRHTVEHSVYVRADQRGRGLGRLLMDDLIPLARACDKHVMVAAIEAGNVGSIRLHETLGFVHVGVMPQVGTKFDRWLDLVWMQLMLDDATPRDPSGENCSTATYPLHLRQVQAEAARLPNMDSEQLRAELDEIFDQSLEFGTPAENDTASSSPKHVVDFTALAAPEPYRLLTGLVVPRPIAWVSTRSSDGVDNLAPHSFFTVASADPAIVQFTSVGRKDTLRNIEATGEFVVNVASSSLMQQMNATAARVDATVDEFDLAGVTKEASVRVAPPRVAESPAALECTLEQVIPVGDSFIVLGRVLIAAVDEGALDGDRVQEWVLDPVARLSGSRYVTYGETISLARPE